MLDITEDETPYFYLTGTIDGVAYRVTLTQPDAACPADWWITETEEVRTVAQHRYPSAAFYEVHTFTGPFSSYVIWKKEQENVKAMAASVVGGDLFKLWPSKN